MRIQYARALELMLLNVLYMRIIHRSLSSNADFARELGRNTHGFVSRCSLRSDRTGGDRGWS